MKKKSFVIACLFALLSSCDPMILPPDNNDIPNDTTSVINANDPASPRGSDYLYDISAVSEIKLSVTVKDWNLFLTNYDLNSANNDYIPGTFTFQQGADVFHIDSVGIRLRGNTSRRRPEGATGELHQVENADWHHAHFQVKFDEYRKKIKFCGSDRVILKWFKDDAMYCREVYSYDLFRRFGVWIAPRVSYTRVSIDVEGDSKPAYFGVYAVIEGVNDAFLANRKDAGKLVSKNGNLWKASWGATLSPNSMSDDKMGVSVTSLNPSESVNYVYDLKTNKKTGLNAARTQLKEFVNTMNGLSSGSSALKTFLEERLDVDQFLRAYAVNVMVGMWDDYWNGQNNYYFYFDETNKFYFIPFDYDNTLGTSLGMNAGTQNLLAWGRLDNERVLMRKVMSISEYKERYKNYIKELASADNDYFYTDKSITRIKAWHTMISPYLSNDTGEDMLLNDVPASWGNCHFYRLLTGDDEGGNKGDANWFKTKIGSINF